jgi:hypothetical protein
MGSLSEILIRGSVLLLTSALPLGAGQDPDPADVLAHYRQSLSYLRSVSLHAVVTVHSSSGASDQFPQTLDYVFRWDQGTQRAAWVGRQLICDKDGRIDPWKSTFIKEIADGQMCVSLDSDRLVEEGDLSRRVILWYNYQERLRDLYENPNYGGPLFGTMYGSNHQTVADLLAASSDLHVRRENIDGVACLVLEGTSPYGQVTAWIAPEKGYSAMKWVLEKEPHHLFNDTALSVKGWRATFEMKQMQTLGAADSPLFAPARAVFTHRIERDGASDVDTYEYAVTDIQPNPDFAALGAFRIDLPEGIRVFNRDSPDLRLQWKNGGPVPLASRRDRTEAASTESTDKRMNTALAKPPARASIWAGVSAGLVLIGAVGWLVFRRPRAGSSMSTRHGTRR